MKFFLTAGANERAQRRFAEEHQQNPTVDFAETLADMTERDRRDSTRTDSPLKIADDAIVIDSTVLSIPEVFERMVNAVHKKAEGRSQA